MLKSLLKNKEFCKIIKDVLNTPGVLDVFLFGSSVRNKLVPSDLDFLVLVSKKDNEMIDSLYFFRKELEKQFSNLHFLIFDYSELLSENFVARQNFFSEAYSFRNKKILAECFGFFSKCFFKYDLTSLSSSKKVSFHYALVGRNKEKGILDKLGGKRVSDSTIMTSVENSDYFKEFLTSQKIKFDFWNILVPNSFK